MDAKVTTAVVEVPSQSERSQPPAGGPQTFGDRIIRSLQSPEFYLLLIALAAAWYWVFLSVNLDFLHVHLRQRAWRILTLIGICFLLIAIAALSNPRRSLLCVVGTILPCFLAWEYESGFNPNGMIAALGALLGFTVTAVAIRRPAGRAFVERGATGGDENSD